MTYTEAVSYIHSIAWTGSRPGLERITDLMARLGNPERELTVIHIAGTNGKGSFCAMLESILRHAGYSTGLFTSPYVEDFRERFCVNGEMISEEELAEIVEYIKPYAEAMADFPTEFEFVTAIGFECFRRRGCEVVILETGMGGRLDSTNIVPCPAMCMITGISFDHMEFLGDTIEKIAAEKAGIIKPGRPILFGGRPPAALPVIRGRAEELGSPFYLTDHSKMSNVEYALDGTTFDFGDMKGLRIPLLSFYQPHNAANVLEAVEIFRNCTDFVISEQAVRDGLANVQWKGRFERLSVAPPVYFDGGHNVQGVESTVASIRHYFGEGGVNLIFGVMGEKEYAQMIELASGVTQQAFCVAPPNPRAMNPQILADEFAGHGVRAVVCSNVADAMTQAKMAHQKNGAPIFALGSLYMYGDVKGAI
ncbi:MAG: bifunctional folylpolyglutamate synthase/dihydrofolate synthase [Oscillospiraceae bacterium]|nr:bifunctional folylpolyglutamate synthase/dihydrofolate synthase [Oscillospiraceae bacterium]